MMTLCELVFSISVDTPQNAVKIMGMFTAWLRDDTGKILYRKDAQGNTCPLYAFKKPGLESVETKVTYEYDQGGSRREAPPVAE